PLLASVNTIVFYTPSDHETAQWISDQLGITTERLHPETQHRSFFGLFEGSSIGTTEHARPLMTSDEVRRLPDDQAIVLTKGCAPILARKLGSPAPEVIDLATPVLRKVAALAGALLLTGSGAVYALWPRTTPPPSLALTTETSPEPAIEAPRATTRHSALAEWWHAERHPGWGLFTLHQIVRDGERRSPRTPNAPMLLANFATLE